MTTGETIAQEALSWIGTPFHPQAKLKGVGVDCVSLAAAAIEASGARVEDSMKYDFSRKIERIQEVMDKIADRVEDEEVGDILLYSSRKLPQHMAIRVSSTEVVTAYAAPINKVVRVPLAPSWDGRLINTWRVRAI